MSNNVFLRFLNWGDNKKQVEADFAETDPEGTTTAINLEWTQGNSSKTDTIRQELIKIIGELPTERQEALPTNQRQTPNRPRGRPFRVVREGKQIHIMDKGFERIAKLADMNDGRVAAQLWKELTKAGITKAIKQTGRKVGI